MIPYQLNIDPPISEKQINYKESLLFLGSCFSENIANLLLQKHFKVLNNPNGITFNPFSIGKPFELLMLKEEYTNKDIVNSQNHCFSKFHHGKINHSHETELLKQINTDFNLFKEKLTNCKHLFITFGSAYVYRLKETNEIAANCHQLPQNQFEKELLTVPEICSFYHPIIQFLEENYPQINLIFTVSPVKHLKDGVAENNISKSTLLLAIHSMAKEFPKIEYFPSYELMNDDLRDYRFYESDGAHPNAIAINYIYEKFKNTFFDKETITFEKEMTAYLKLKNHQPILNSILKTQQLQMKIESLGQELSKKYKIIL